MKVARGRRRRRRCRDTYAISSTDPNAYKYDAKPQIDAYVDLVSDSYADATAAHRRSTKPSMNC